MNVVSDTSPINHLCQIGHIQILPTLFHRVLIPAAVTTELSREKTSAMVRQFVTNPPSWLEVRPPAIIDVSLEQLGAGEREAISLAQEIQADLVIVDDKAARRAATQLGLNVIGTLGVLKQAAALSLVELPTAVDALQAIGFYMSDQLIQELKRHY